MKSMNKKLMIIPTIILSSALLLTGCTSGKSEPGKGGSPNPTSSSSSADPSNGEITQPTGNGGYVAPPAELDDKYKGYFMAPTSTNEEAWSYYKSIGATTYKEDPATRSTTAADWASARSDDKSFDKFDKMYGEVLSDVEQSALNISSHLEKNPSASLDEISNSDLVINRYKNLGETTVEKDSNKGFYFVIFTINDDKSGGYGILVPQKGVTPDFNAPPSQ